MPKNYFTAIFILAFIARYIFAVFSGIDNFSGPDSSRYDFTSDQILAGNYNLLVTEGNINMVLSPVYPYLMALFKLLFSSNYILALEFFQICLSSLSVIFMVKLAFSIYSDAKVAIFIGIIYSIFPTTLYFTHLFSQETIFQSLFVISIYYYYQLVRYPDYKYVVMFGALFSLATLTKSHALVIFPFLVMGIGFSYGLSRLFMRNCLVIATTFLLISAPYSLFNQKVNDNFVISSSGSGLYFLVGHNDDFYRFVTNPPDRDTDDYKKLVNLDYQILNRIHLESMDLKHSEIQKKYIIEGVKWSLSNPSKFFTLLVVNIKNFLQPGYNKLHHEFIPWLITFIISFPIFIFAYCGIYRALLFDPRTHVGVLSIFLGMLVISIIFFTQNRFRVITIEPFYVFYACVFFLELYQKLKIKFLPK